MDGVDEPCSPTPPTGASAPERTFDVLRRPDIFTCSRQGLLGFTLFIRAGLCFTTRMDRFVLTDAQWAKMEPRCLGKPGDPGRSGKDNRLFVEAVLWIVRTGSPWRHLPVLFGNWNSVFTRFRDWV